MRLLLPLLLLTGQGVHALHSLVAEDSLSTSSLSATSSAESNARQAEASIEQVQTDMKRMATFGEEVARNLREQDETRKDVDHALSYFRRQIELGINERDIATNHVQRLEAEVTQLQSHVHELESRLASCQNDKRTLSDANKKVIGQLSSVFKLGQSVETGLALQGLATNVNSTDL